MEEKVELKVVQQMKAFPRFNRRPFYSYVQDSISSPCEQLNGEARDERRWKRSEASCLKLACHRNRPIAEYFSSTILPSSSFFWWLTGLPLGRLVSHYEAGLIPRGRIQSSRQPLDDARINVGRIAKVACDKG